MRLQTIGSDGEITSYDLQRADTKIPPLPQDVSLLSPRRPKSVALERPVQYEEAEPFQPTPAEPSMAPVADASLHASETQNGSVTNTRPTSPNRNNNMDLSKSLRGVKMFNGVLLGGSRPADDEARLFVLTFVCVCVLRIFKVFFVSLWVSYVDLCVCVCVCVCVCISVCACLSLCVRLWVSHMYIYCVCACICVCACLSLFARR